MGKSGTRLIALTGYAQPEDVKRATEAGFDGYPDNDQARLPAARHRRRAGLPRPRGDAGRGIARTFPELRPRFARIACRA